MEQHNEVASTAARSWCLYGDSGLGKTTACAHGARYWYAKTGLPVRLISAEDPTKVIFEPLIRAGIVQAYFITHVADPLSAFRNLSLGQWPQGDGKWLPYKPGTVSAYIIEGLTSVSELLGTACIEGGFLGGEQKTNNFQVGAHKFGRLSLMGYGFCQDEVLRNVRAFAAIPGIDKVLWTAHEVKGTDSDNLTIRGPALAGSAKTKVVQKYFGAVLHLDGVSKDVAGLTSTQRKLWFEPHPDPTFPTVHYPSKIVLPPAEKAALLAEFPRGYIEPTLQSSVEVLLCREDELIAASVDEAMSWKAEIDAAREAK